MPISWVFYFFTFLADTPSKLWWRCKMKWGETRKTNILAVYFFKRKRKYGIYCVLGCMGWVVGLNLLGSREICFVLFAFNDFFSQVVVQIMNFVADSFFCEWSIINQGVGMIIYHSIGRISIENGSNLPRKFSSPYLFIC